MTHEYNVVGANSIKKKKTNQNIDTLNIYLKGEGEGEGEGGEMFVVLLFVAQTFRTGEHYYCITCSKMLADIQTFSP